MNKEVQNPEVKFNAHARVLAQALKRLQPVAKNGSVLPIVNGNVHVGLTGNTATLSATDLETRVSVTIAVQNTTPNPAAEQPNDTLSEGESYGTIWKDPLLLNSTILLLYRPGCFELYKLVRKGRYSVKMP